MLLFTSVLTEKIKIISLKNSKCQENWKPCKLSLHPEVVEIHSYFSKSPGEHSCRTLHFSCSHSCFLFIYFPSSAFTAQSGHQLFFFFSIISFLFSFHLFSLPPHFLVGLSLGPSNMVVLHRGMLQCSSSYWAILLLLHGTMGGI